MKWKGWGVFWLLGLGRLVVPAHAQEEGALKHRLVQWVNWEREAVGQPPVQFDELASLVADRHCREMLAADYGSPYNQAGLKPYHRYSFAGGTEFVAEIGAGGVFKGYSPKKALTSFYRAIMAERPPHDRRRREVLNPHHTHLGVGLVAEQDRVAITMIFLNRYLHLVPHPRRVRINETVRLSGQPLKGYAVASIALCQEPLPRPLSPAELRRKKTYLLPADRLFLRRQLTNGGYSNGPPGRVEVFADGRFTVVLPPFTQPGIYTVLIWVESERKESIPAGLVSLLVSDGSAAAARVEARCAPYLEGG